MKKLIGMILVVVMLVSACAFAEATEIKVTGVGSDVVPADTATISLGVSAYGTDAISAQSSVNASIASVKQALTANGLDSAAINTDYISLYPEMDYSDTVPTLVGYTASCTLGIRVTDMEKAGSYIDIALEAGANTLNSVVFSASEYSEAETAALNNAVADARKKAETLAHACGLKITGIKEIISNSEAGSIDSYSNSYKVESAGDTGTDIQSAGLSVDRTVTIIFTAEAE